MARRKRTRSFSPNDLQDNVGVMPEVKRRKFLEFIDGNSSKDTNVPRNSKTTHYKNEEDKDNDCSKKCGKWESATRHRRRQKVSMFWFRKQSSRFFFTNSFHEQQHRFKTLSKRQNNFCRRTNISFLDKEENSTFERISSNSAATTTNDEPKLNQDSEAFESFKEINTSNLSRRLSSKSPASLTEQLRASDDKSVEQSSADYFELYRRREKLKPVDAARSLYTNFQTHDTQSHDNRQMQRSVKYESDIIGRTPCTAIEIDSSDEEEIAAHDTGSTINPCEQRCQPRLQSAGKRLERFKIAYPSRTDPEAVEILASDVQLLNPLEFLNDTIIDFYIKYIQREFLSLERSRRFHFFNSFFYKKLCGVVGKKREKTDNFSKLRKWTKGINIFEKDYLFVPVHSKLHWSLAIICFPNHGPGSASGSERCILHLDSMNCGHDSSTVFRLLHRYLVAEWKYTFAKGGERGGNKLSRHMIPTRKVPVPLQENGSDCGLFLLYYIQKFVERAPGTLKISDVENRLESIGLFGRRWFLPTEASSLRTTIRQQLLKLFAQDAKAQGIAFKSTMKKEREFMSCEADRNY
ncbi:uncharacterized protein [Physcomitrium patens]|uniref:Ubiquitin-like protease family profile domain-containing protein n=1 Tax=Physcomitrium patens TaxID=3218 RepID=A0A7I4FQH3_PHYPA|nr:sentrin-specific protease 1-like isoform X2 [Physcomitrium patens]|eukprot:XP_024375883.1 sentrin-specific protease 1-like isoform X2 [Physcomitrella patens]